MSSDRDTYKYQFRRPPTGGSGTAASRTIWNAARGSCAASTGRATSARSGTGPPARPPASGRRGRPTAGRSGPLTGGNPVGFQSSSTGRGGLPEPEESEGWYVWEIRLVAPDGEDHAWLVVSGMIEQDQIARHLLATDPDFRQIGKARRHQGLEPATEFKPVSVRQAVPVPAVRGARGRPRGGLLPCLGAVGGRHDHPRPLAVSPRERVRCRAVMRRRPIAEPGKAAASAITAQAPVVDR